MEAEREPEATRRRVARLVGDLYDERIRSTEFFDRVRDIDTRGDPELHELLELVGREPANTWLFGVSGEVDSHNARRIRELVVKFAEEG